MQRPCFMPTPYGNWQKSIVSLVVWYAQLWRNYPYITTKFQNCRPKSGWTDETKRFVKHATKVAVGDAK